MPRANRLGSEISPHLLLHAGQPVDWYPWGHDAFEAAKHKNLPVFCSIGDSTSFLCHAMARESFSDPTIAQFLNDHYVCIKVDRRERPDVHQVYGEVARALNQTSSGPLLMFLTPDQEPFFAGQYFPAEDRENRPGFLSLLMRVEELWKQDHVRVKQQAAELLARLEPSFPKSGPRRISADTLVRAGRALIQDLDETFGGFGTGAKVARPQAIRLLLRLYRIDGKKTWLHAATLTLDAMMHGALYDQLGGGFFQGCLDRRWEFPLLTKELGANAQLASTYLEAYQVTGSEAYRRVARETLEFMLRELRGPGGAFFAAVSTEDQAKRGAYFGWTTEQVREVVPEPAATRVIEFFSLSKSSSGPDPSPEARVPRCSRPLAQLAQEFGIDDAELLTDIEAGREALLAVRSRRSPPLLDDCIIASENGLAIAALAEGAAVLGEPRYLDAALAAAAQINSKEEGSGLLGPGRRLLRLRRGDQSRGPACLEDYACLALGLLSLYEVGAGREYLEKSQRLCDLMLEDFSANDDGCLFLTARSQAPLIRRPADGWDHALPAGNSVAAQVLYKLSLYLRRQDLLAKTEGIVSAFAAPLRKEGGSFCSLLCVVDLLLEPPLSVYLDAQYPEDRELLAEVYQRFIPHRLLAPEAGTDKASGASQLPMEAPSAEDAEPSAEKRTTRMRRGDQTRGPCGSAEEFARALSELCASLNRKTELFGRRIEGFATQEGTSRHAHQGPLADSSFRRLDGLFVSQLGLGTHRAGLDHPGHREAVRHALSSGLNLIDTSPTFAFGDSERVIGEVVADLIDEEIVARDSLCIVSKVGVALGAEAEELSQQKKKAGTLPHTVALKSQGATDPNAALEAGAFSLAPWFIERQIQGSLDRLNVSTLDVCLIQSPEHLFAAGMSTDDVLAAVRDAFEVFERQVAAGWIRRYGVMSNSLSWSSESSLSLSDLIRIAGETGGAAHHFRVLELPLNLVECAALQADTDGRSLLARAQEAGLDVLSCRPLSAWDQGALLRLADPPSIAESQKLTLSSARYKVASLEAEFETTLAPRLRLARRLGPERGLPLSGALSATFEKVQTLSQFEAAESALVTPRLRAALHRLDQCLAGEPDGRWKRFRENYIAAVGAYLSCVRTSAIRSTEARLGKIEAAAQTSPWGSAIDERWYNSPWTDRALLPLLTLPEVQTVLVGLRSRQHVEQAVSLLTPRKNEVDPNERKAVR